MGGRSLCSLVDYTRLIIFDTALFLNLETPKNYKEKRKIFYIVYSTSRLLDPWSRSNCQHSPTQLRATVVRRSWRRRRTDAASGTRRTSCVYRRPFNCRELSRHVFQIPQLWGCGYRRWTETLEIYNILLCYGKYKLNCTLLYKFSFNNWNLKQK